jgi:hypothetical protein
MVIKNVCKVPVIFWPSLTELKFWRPILQDPKYKVFRKSGQREPLCSTRTDRRTAVTKLTVAFCNFANTPKKHVLLDISRLKLETAARSVAKGK